MADRIFPNRYQEDPLDSDLVFQGIDWDTFNQRLAAAESGEGKKIPTELLKALNNAHPEAFDNEARSNDRESGSMYAEEDDEEMSDEDVDAMMVDAYKTAKKKGLDPDSGLAKWLAKNKKGKQNKSKDDDEEMHDEDHEDHEEDEDDAKGPMKRKGPKKDEKVKKAYIFNHPSQLSADAVEAAEAAGDEHLKSAILAARHDRRVRLASQIETRIASEKDKSVRLAQRRAYREAIVQSVEENVNQPKTHKTASRSTSNSGMTSSMKTAFAQKALAEGFPVEYIQARLGEMPAVQADNTTKIKSVLASELDINTKIAAASSMIKTATLSDADYSRLVDYWKNDLGYGDQEWIDALFTKKYDKKN